MNTKIIIGISIFPLLLLALTIRNISANAGAGQFVDASPQTLSDPQVRLQAASGMTIAFKTQNGKTVDGIPAQTLELPHLVLYRNGELTPPEEHTLSMTVSGIEVPPPGVTVTLQIETQHGDPDQGGGKGNRITVWQELQWLPNTSTITQTSVTASFEYKFGERIISDSESIPTPTDYFRYEIIVVDRGHPFSSPLYTVSQDYAFLMENQWIAPLPEVLEETEGAAPDEIIVYYSDMFPFQKKMHDKSTWLRREAVQDYVGTELVPAMLEAFRIQTNEWGFAWNQAWTSFRPGEDAKRISVALTDGRTWFHSRAKLIGHAGISITVKAGQHYGRADYDTLTDKLMSVFQHELFHNLQRNIEQHNGGNGVLDGMEGAWQFFSEGTAVLASTVGQADMQLTKATASRDYMFKIDNFLVEDINKSYGEMNPFHAALYWRFLYEQCGGMKNGVEDPTAGMRVIKRALNVLYSKEKVDINTSSDLIAGMPAVMDRALEGSDCPFKTYEESLVDFADAINALRLGSDK